MLFADMPAGGFIGIGVVIVVLLYLLFPLVVLWYLGRITSALWKIEQNTKPQKAREKPQAKAEVKVAEKPRGVAYDPWATGQ